MKKLIVIAIAGIMVLLTGAGTASGRNRVSRIVRLAGHGDPAAQLDYARLLKTTGNGGKGNPETQYKVGSCCQLKGQGTARDMSEAVSWYRKSAAQGYREAIDALKAI